MKNLDLEIDKTQVEKELQEARIMTDYKTEFEKALYSMISCWQHACHEGSDENNCLEIDHKNMTTFEYCCDLLEKHGYGIDQGYTMALTTKGLKLLGKYDKEDYTIKYNGSETSEKNAKRIRYLKSYYNVDNSHFYEF